MKKLINIGKNLKKILNDSNVELVGLGLNATSSLNGVANELNKIKINRLPYLLRNEIIELYENDFGDGEKILEHAFYKCTSLKNVTIPESITSIGADAFYGCTNLVDIYFEKTTPPTLGNSRAIPSYTTIHVPIGSGSAYKSATNWSEHARRIVEDIIIE
jgi:hypothetical protein